MKKIFLILVISITIFMVFNSTIAYADVNATRAKIDSQVNTIVKTVGYLFILIWAVKEVLEEMQTGDMRSVLSVALKYAVVYAVLLALPMIFKWSETFLEGLR